VRDIVWAATAGFSLHDSRVYQLLETYYEQVKAIWEQRFEKKL